MMHASSRASIATGGAAALAALLFDSTKIVWSGWLMKYSALKLFGAGFQRRYFVFDGTSMRYYKKPGGKPVKNEAIPLSSLNRVAIPSIVATPSTKGVPAAKTHTASSGDAAAAPDTSVDLVFTSRTFTLGAVAADVHRDTGRPDNAARDASLEFIDLLRSLKKKAAAAARARDRASAGSVAKGRASIAATESPKGRGGGGATLSSRLAGLRDEEASARPQSAAAAEAAGLGGGAAAASAGQDQQKLAKRTRKMVFILMEILSTETNYATSLSTVCTSVVEPLRAKLDRQTHSISKLVRRTTANSLFSKTDFCLVFSNIEKLRDLAMTFEEDLDKALHSAGINKALVTRIKLGDTETLAERNSAIRAIQKVAEAFTRFAPYFPAVYR